MDGGLIGAYPYLESYRCGYAEVSKGLTEGGAIPATCR